MTVETEVTRTDSNAALSIVALSINPAGFGQVDPSITYTTIKIGNKSTFIAQLAKRIHKEPLAS